MDNYFEYFKIVYDAFQTDCNRFWRLFQSLTIINAGLFSVLSFIGRSEEIVISREYVITFSVAGALICIIWGLMQLRMARWVDWYDNKLGEVEGIYLSKLGEN